MMKMTGFRAGVFWVVILPALCLAAGGAGAATIKVDGKEYADAELFEIGVKGPFYKIGEDVVVVVPWAEVDRFEAAAIRQRFGEALVNLHQKAYWVQGTVFEKTEAGVVVHTGSSAEGGEDGEKKEGRKERKEKTAAEAVERQMEKGGDAVFKNGAEVATGLVVLKDLPRSQYSEGSPVATLAYLAGKVPYEVGLGMKKDLMVCNIAKPGWVGVRKWRNKEGKDMVAELVAVKAGKCLFHRGEQSFVYPLDQLSNEHQQLVADFQQNSREIPLKEGN